VKDYYEILELDHLASKSEVKKAFRIKAREWHPDKNNSPDATKKMQLINEAYLILSDDEARDRYEQEYKNYNSFKSQIYTHTTKDYSFNDDVLKDWINKAKNQAKSMGKQSLDDLLGISNAAFTSAFQATKFYILFLVIGLILSMFLRR